MKKVICDTNIWYGLGNGTLQKPTDGKLVATWNNVMEIGFSHKEIKSLLDENSVKRAAKAIIDYSDEIIHETPFHFVAKTIIPDLDLKSIDLNPIIQEIAFNGLADSSTYLQHKPAYDAFMKMKEDFQNGINSGMKELKQTLKETSKDQRKSEFLLGILDDVKSFLMIEHQKEIKFDDDRDLRETLSLIDGAFPLIASVKVAFFEHFASQKEMKVQPNDFFDLLNLYYVQQEDLYWTLEKRWNNLITSNKY